MPPPIAAEIWVIVPLINLANLDNVWFVAVDGNDFGSELVEEGIEETYG